MSFTVVFIVSSSVQSIPNAVRAQGQSRPHNSPYSSTYHAQTTKPKRYWTSTKNQEIQTLLTTILSLWMLRDVPDRKSQQLE